MRAPQARAAGAALTVFLWSWSCVAWGLDHAVLFVGNSYTSANQLDVVYGSLISEGMPAWIDVSIARYAPGGYRLPQHATDATSNTQLDSFLHDADPSHEWDAVVLQDQSQVPSFPAGQADYLASRAAAVTLAAEIDAIGAQTALFLTWGRRDGDADNMLLNPDFLTMQENLTVGYAGYRDAISEAGVIAEVVPVGTAWKYVYDSVQRGGEEPTEGDTLFTRLYSGDGSHPSAHGTYLTACTMFAALTLTSPEGLSWAPSGVSAMDRDALQTAAAQTVLGSPGAGGSGEPAGGTGSGAGGGTGNATGAGGHGGASTRPVAGGAMEGSGANPGVEVPTGCSYGVADSRHGHLLWLLLWVVAVSRRTARRARTSAEGQR